MNVLFISKNGSSLGLAERVRKEGHNASFHILEKEARSTGEGIVEKPSFDLPISRQNGQPIQSNIKKLLKETDPDMVVFDMVKSGKVADYIRINTPVLGASRWADHAELDRSYGYKLMKQVGIKIPSTKQFESGETDEAISFVKKNKKKRYVYKPSGNIDASHTYVSEGPEDMECMLDLWRDDACEFDLQEVVEGVEVSCELWWNGLRADIHNITFEEKKFMNDDVGPAIGCAGNIVKMVSPKSKIVKEGIGKMERLLKKTNYRGPIDLNSIVNEKGLWGLEFTVRFGYDALQALLEIHKGSVTQFLHSMATSTRGYGDFTSDYAIAVRLSVPPYPHTEKDVVKGVPILKVSNESAKHLWWVDARKTKKGYKSAGVLGDILVAVARGRYIDECRGRVYRTIHNLIIPQVQYRTDIGERVERNERRLKQLGYLI